MPEVKTFAKVVMLCRSMVGRLMVVTVMMFVFICIFLQGKGKLTTYWLVGETNPDHPDFAVPESVL